MNSLISSPRIVRSTVLVLDIDLVRYGAVLTQLFDEVLVVVSLPIRRATVAVYAELRGRDLQYCGMEFGMRSCRKSLTTIESTGNSVVVRTWALQIGDMQSSGFSSGFSTEAGVYR